MQYQTIVVSLVLCLASQEALAASSSVSPLSKVVELLNGLKGTLVKDGERSAVEFKEFKAFCHKSGRNLDMEINDDMDEIEDDDAVISKSDADISSASSKIEDEAATLSGAEGDGSAAKQIRAKEKEEFKSSEAELVDTIATLERASNVLQRKMKRGSLVQVNTEMQENNQDIKALLNSLSAVIDGASLSLHDKSKLTALVQSSQEEDDEESLDELGAPAAAKYKSHGGTILDLLEDLTQKAQTSLNDLRKEEKQKAHNYDLLINSVQDQMNVAGKEMKEAKETKHVSSQLKAGAHGELIEDTKEYSSDKESRANVGSRCRQAALDYDETLRSQKEEIGAIDAALGALATVKPKAAAFLQAPNSLEKTQSTVTGMLRHLAARVTSSDLMQLAGRVSTALSTANLNGAMDPFEKVRGMISDMIKKLQKEAEEESGHKAYCDKEQAETKTKIEDLTYTSDKAQAQIDKAKAKAASLNNDLAKLQQELATISEEQGEADKMRAEQKATNEQSKADLEQGVKGVQFALKTLRAYYEKSSEAETEFLQQSSRTPNQGMGGSVISILEMVEGDMTKELSAINSEESEAINNHKKLTEDNTRNRLVKEQAEKFKKKDKVNLAKTLAEYSSDLDSTQSEMDAVLEYGKKIDATCAPQPTESYEERSSRRKAEVEGLQEAIKQLEGGASLLQVAPRQTSLRGKQIMKH